MGIGQSRPVARERGGRGKGFIIAVVKGRMLTNGSRVAAATCQGLQPVKCTFGSPMQAKQLPDRGLETETSVPTVLSKSQSAT